jgi:hypothetical protein
MIKGHIVILYHHSDIVVKGPVYSFGPMLPGFSYDRKLLVTLIGKSLIRL